MTKRRSILWNGLKLVVKRPGALLWTFALNLGLALVFSLRLHAQLASILDHSMAAERLNSAFDLGTLEAALYRLGYMAPSTGATSYLGLPLYFLGYFVLVPGALYCYRTEAPARLSILVSTGITYLWRFLRITLLTVIVSAIILGPLVALQNSWSNQVDENAVGFPAFAEELAGWVIILLVAALVRLYFDLVEVYTVQLGGEDGKQDRRVRRALLPALRTLWHNLPRAYSSFLLLALLGFAAPVTTGYIAMHMLAQPRMWPTFLLLQIGLIGMMAARFWQRGAETILANDILLLDPTARVEERVSQAATTPDIEEHLPMDAQSDPEPAAPSLEEPDMGVYHHEPEHSTDREPEHEPSAAPEPEAESEPKPDVVPDRQVPWWQE